MRNRSDINDCCEGSGNAFPLVKQVFLGAADDAPIVKGGAIDVINKAEPTGDVVVLDFPLVEDHGAFIACLVVGGEANDAIDDATWAEIFVPLLKGDSEPYPRTLPMMQLSRSGNCDRQSHAPKSHYTQN